MDSVSNRPRKRRHPGRAGAPISLDPLTFDEAMGALANPTTGENASEGDPESETEDSQSDHRPSDLVD